MNTTAEVQAAQRALDVAQQHAKDERHVQLVNELEQTTQRLEEAQSEYAGLRERVLTLRAKRAGLQNAMSELIGLQAEHSSARPRAADFLPHDRNVIQWTKAAARLEEQRVAIVRELAETSIVSTMDMDLTKLSAQITRLQFSQGNLLSALEALKGPQPYLSAITQAPGGGISRVVWK
ncbi:MAG TPA: hypothetical protein VMA34_02625 [Terracidiphilus sp.]|nr:hypothetical protein [Terracidiphilus sp.]